MRPTTPPRKENLVTETKTREQNIYGDRGEAHQDTGLMMDNSQTQQGAEAKEEEQSSKLECTDIVPD